MPITDPSDFNTTLCPAWWDPDDISGVDGDDITSWADAQQSLALAAATNKPTVSESAAEPSSHKTAQFTDNLNHRLTVTNAALALSKPCYIILYAPFRIASGENQWLFNKTNSSNPSTFAAFQSNTESDRMRAVCRLDGSEGTTRSAVASSHNTRAVPQVVTTWYDGSELVMRINGTEVASTAVSGLVDTDTNGSLCLGNHPSSGAYPHARFGDVVVLSDPSLTNVEDVENWMMARWNISDYEAAWTTGSVVDEVTPDTGEIEIFSPSICTVGSTNYMFVAVRETGGDFRWVAYWTSPTSDPHNWTDQGNIIDADTDSPAECRGVAAVHDGANWNIIVDAGDGGLYHFEGSSLASLTDNGLVFSGGGLGYARHPNIVQTQVGGDWLVYWDVRTDSAAGELGYIARSEVSADFATWSNSQKVLDVSDLWWEKSDVGSPCVRLRDGQYEMAYAGYNDALGVNSIYPHHIGLAKSSDGTTFTKLPEGVPIYAPEHGNSPESVGDPELFHDGTNYWLYFQSRNDEGSDADVSRIQLGSAALSFLAASGGGAGASACQNLRMGLGSLSIGL